MAPTAAGGSWSVRSVRAAGEGAIRAGTLGVDRGRGLGATRVMAGKGTGSVLSNEAFIERVHIEGNKDGPLKGLTVAVKDIFDLAGTKTGFGHPQWREQQRVSQSSAWAVRALLDSGATVVGKSFMDEFAWSLFGVNVHYGTPVNPAAPDRVPGGSSSGSASAVAAELASIGLGSDTGGSVRVPASYCGLYGIRPTHAAVSTEGALPLAPSFDTVGWLTRDMHLLSKVGDVLLPHKEPTSAAPKQVEFLVATDAFALMDPSVAAPLMTHLKRALASTGQDCTEVEMYGGGESLEWFEVFRTLQSSEVWGALGDWVSRNRPSCGPGTGERFEFAKSLALSPPAALETAKQRRAAIAAQLVDLLGGQGSPRVLMLPTCSGPPPRLDASAEDIARERIRVLQLTCAAGLAGLPQISMPIPGSQTMGGPVGLSFVGAPGSDRELLRVCANLDGVLSAQLL